MKCKNFYLPFITALYLSTALIDPACAGTIQAPAAPPPPYGPGYLGYVYFRDMSDDGRYFTTFLDNGNGAEEAAIYNRLTGTYTFIPGADNFASINISGDGNVVIGMENYFTYGNFIWTAGSGMSTLTGPSGFSALRFDFINYDGSVIAGTGTNANGEFEAFYRTSGGSFGIGELPGTYYGDYSMAYALSDDGRYIVGASDSAIGMQPFRYDRDTSTMVGLGLMSGSTYGAATAISGDGQVVAGYNEDSNYDQTPFRWTVGTGSVSLGVPAGFDSGGINLVNYDGSVLFGTVYGGGTFEAVRWTTGGGYELASDYLTATGINMSGVTLATINRLSMDGNILLGTADIGNGFEDVIISLTGGGGITTPAALGTSLSLENVPSEQMTQVSTGAAGNSMFAARMLSFRMPAPSSPAPSVPIPASVSSPASAADLSPAAGGEMPDLYARIRPTFTAYSYGSFGVGQDNDIDNHGANGTAGIRAEIGHNFYVGGGVIASSSREDMDFGGESSLQSYGLSALASFEGDTGLRLYGALFASRLDAEIERSYRNGGDIDTSTGEADGFAYGAAIHAGWEHPLTEKTSIQPYAEVSGAHARLDGYQEDGGAFDAEVSERTQTTWTSRLGAEVKTEVLPSLDLSLRGAWGHRLSSTTSDLAVTSIGVTTSFSPSESDRDWAEAGAGLEWEALDRLMFSTDVSGRTARTEDPYLTLMIGAAYRL